MKFKHLSFIFILTMLFLLILSPGTQAQEEQYEKIKAMKIAYITEQLNLTPAEAEVFWPVYNEFENTKNKIHDDRKSLAEYFTKNSGNLSNEEISKTLDEYIGFYKADTDLLIQFNEKLKEILPPEKVMKLHLAEIQFRHYLIEKLREQRGQGPRK